MWNIAREKKEKNIIPPQNNEAMREGTETRKRDIGCEENRREQKKRQTFSVWSATVQYTCTAIMIVTL